MALLLKIITPDMTVLNDIEVKSVTVQTIAGTMTILENHTPIVSTIINGNLIYRTNNNSETFSLEKGLIKISAKNIKVLAENCKKIETK